MKSPTGGGTVRAAGRGFLAVVDCMFIAAPLHAFVCEISEQQKITLPEQAFQTGFGSVAVDGDVAVIGAPKDSVEQYWAGSISIYYLDDSGTPANPHDDVWIRRQRLGAPDGARDDEFGCSVAISGEWIVVGAWGRDDPLDEAGAVYLFRRNDGDTPGDGSDDSWFHFQTLTSPCPDDHGVFGISVAIDGDYIVIGACDEELPGGPTSPGAAYVFRYLASGADKERSDGAWIAQTRLVSSQPKQLARFGQAVSISGDRLIVGAPSDHHDGTPYTGAAYVFRRDYAGTPADPADDEWVQEAKIVPTDARRGDAVGVGVAILGDWAIVGAPGNSEVAPGAGAAYAFRRYDHGTPGIPSDDRWLFRWKMRPPTPPDGDVALFGSSVAKSKRYVLVGAPHLDVPPLEDVGKVYLFFHDDRGTPDSLADDLFWDFAEFGESDERATDRFGGCVFLSDEHAAVAARGKDDACPDISRCDSGAVYFFNVGADCNGNDFPDSCDTKEGFSPDCNANGIPDDCPELDPNENGNGVPDDCEIPGDCNLNLRIDPWDQIVQTICITTGGPHVSNDNPCVCADADGDGDVDLHDVALYQTQVGR